MSALGDLLRGAIGSIPIVGGVIEDAYRPPRAFPQPGCPRGFAEDSRGNCVRIGVDPRNPGTTVAVPGMAGAIQRFLPGGRTGTVTVGGPGGFGPSMAGHAPEEKPVSRADCGRGYVLGQNGLCYDKRIIPNKMRMWPKGPRPLLTGGEMNTVRKAERLRGRVTKAADLYGLHSHPRKKKR
jgi:hypothetical protein